MHREVLVKNLDGSQISAVSRIFSSAVINEMARKGHSSLFSRLAHESKLFSELDPENRVYDVFNYALKILQKKEHRPEYVYKSALTQNILLGKHSLQSACMSSEFRVEDCRVDVAIFNGTATAYEIKSERDSLFRLEKQISAYRRFFAKVYVIAGENHLHGISDVIHDDVGLLKLSSRNSISLVREAQDLPERTNSTTIFESIRLSEAKQILSLLKIKIPNVPNSELHIEMRNLFVDLPPQDVHTAMVKVLKRTRNLLPLSTFINSLPTSLQSAALSCSIRKADQSRLIQAVETNLIDAMNWSN
jgi:hypothetical protein